MKKIKLFILFTVMMCLTAFSQNNILVIDYDNAFSSDQDNNASNIYNRLLATQTSVVRVNAIPATINSATYDQVWIFGNMGTPGAATLNPIINYMNAGGAVYVQSEVGCCNNEAAFVDQLINATVTAGGGITHSTIKQGNYEFEPNPSLICNPWNHRGAAARIFNGVPASNTLFVANNTCGVAGAPTTGDVVGVQFASCDMISGQGALIVIGDINLFVLNTACAQPLLLNTPNNNNNLIIDFIANLFPSLLVCGSPNPTSAAISYTPYSYCSTDPNPTPTTIGTTGGTFTIDNGGVINTSTGEIDIASSGIGTFNVTYTTGGSCPDTNSVNIIINTCSICDTICGPNLAPNPGFEGTTLQCADTVSEMFTNYSQAQNWQGIACDTCAGNGSTPDYNNSLCSGPASTNACDGSNGSIGFFTYAIAGANAREYVQAQLTTPLVAGMEYCISIDAKTSSGSFAYKPSDGLGLWFTNQMVDIDVQNGGQQFIGPGSLINATPQVENASGNFIDTVCQTITGTFIATGTEQWVVIGNFRDDASTQFNTACSFFSPCFGYLIIDNISVRTSCNNVPLPPTITLSAINDTVCNASCTDITATVTGGTAPYTVTWNNGLPNGNGPQNVCPTTTTTYTAIVTDSAGLADTASIIVYVNSTSTGSNTTTICSSDSLFVGGAWQNTTGTYNDTLTNALGCDSLLTTTLTVIPSITTSNNVSICQGDSLFVGGNWQFTSGSYADTLVSASGCDSVYTTTITVLSVSSFIANTSICNGDSLFAGGAWQTVAGAYLDTLTNAVGCDSILTTNLTVVSTIITNNSVAICSGDSLLIGGTWQTIAGTYSDTLTSVGGCDSIAQTMLTVNVILPTNITSTICVGDSLFAGGAWQTTTGIYSDTLTSIGGCDSVINTNLTVLPPPVAVISGLDSICEGTSLILTANGGGTYLWNTNDTSSTITINPALTTVYTVIVAVGNCVDTTNFTVLVNPTPVIDAGVDVAVELGQSTTLTATGGGVNAVYTWSPTSWLSCVICPSTIATPEETITYTVTAVDSNGCSATDDVTVIVNYDNVVWVPNIFSPNGDGNNDVLFVRGKGVESFQFVVYDRWGEKVFETTDLSFGWDGRFRGKDMNKAVFAYYLKGFFVDGTEFNQKGDITLVR